MTVARRRANNARMNREVEQQSGVEVRTYFVRGRNALVARADFSELYVDYYLFLAEHGLRFSPEQDELLKEAIATMALHGASRPRNELTAWTVNFQQPLMNLFVTANNESGSVVGNVFSEHVKAGATNLFCAEVMSGRGGTRRSAVDFEGSNFFRAAERFYAQSEQRPARFFTHHDEDFVMISAQPDCDLDWLRGLTDETVRALDEQEKLSLLETRRYEYRCGCNQERILKMLAPMARQNANAIFGDEESVTVSCPRCGSRYAVSQEAMEAFIAEEKHAE